MITERRKEKQHRSLCNHRYTYNWALYSIHNPSYTSEKIINWGTGYSTAHELFMYFWGYLWSIEHISRKHCFIFNGKKTIAAQLTRFRIKAWLVLKKINLSLILFLLVSVTKKTTSHILHSFQYQEVISDSGCYCNVYFLDFLLNNLHFN
jgi:hypothetical protein